MKKCKSCKSELVDGPTVERTGESDGISCRVRGIPTKICPSGCAGQYWYWLDFGVEALDALDDKSDNVARRKIGMFKDKQMCKTCAVELVDKKQTENFVFQKMLDKGTMLDLTMTAPALQCPTCQKKYLAANTSRSDPFYGKLGDAIEAAVKKDLIYRESSRVKELSCD